MVEALRRERGNAARELERLGMGELKRRRIVELGRLRPDRLDDRVAVMPRIGAPHAGGAVEQRAPFGGVIMHVLGARDQPRRLLEGAVGRERHPIGRKVVGDRDGGGHWRCRYVHLLSLPLSVPCRCARRLLPTRVSIIIDRPWPRNPTNPTGSRRGCHAGSTTAARPRSRRRGAWWSRFAPSTSATASSRWRRPRSNIPTRLA